MNTLTAARDHLYNYYDALPFDFTRQAAIGFTTAFVIRSIIRNDPKSGLVAGALSVTATAIHALITPLFKYVIGDRERLTWSQEMARGSLALIGTAYIALALGDQTLMNSLFDNAVLYGICATNHSYRNLNQSNSILVFPHYISA